MMKTRTFALLVCPAIILSHAFANSSTDFLPPAPAAQAWKLVWHDEFDGKEVWRSAAGGVSQVPEYLKLTEQIGKWGGEIRDAQLPDSFEVEYVRVYDLVDRPK